MDILLLIIIVICLFLSIKIFKENKNEQFSNKKIAFNPNLSKLDISNIKNAQKKMSNMLKIFDKICQKHKIEYFLVGGSLIGALLYEGWIPWDGDIDLVINGDHYKQFKEIIQSELPDNIWFQNSETDSNYPKNNVIISKLRDLNSCYIEYTNNAPTGKQIHNGLQIDILLYYNQSNNLFKFSDPDEPLMDKQDVYPLKRVPFENFNVTIMNNSKKYLDNKYGANWTEILPVDKRLPHEGLMNPNKTCDHHYKLYPQLYHNK